MNQHWCLEIMMRSNDCHQMHAWYTYSKTLASPKCKIRWNAAAKEYLARLQSAKHLWQWWIAHSELSHTISQQKSNISSYKTYDIKNEIPNHSNTNMHGTTHYCIHVGSVTSRNTTLLCSHSRSCGSRTLSKKALVQMIICTPYTKTSYTLQLVALCPMEMELGPAWKSILWRTTMDPGASSKMIALWTVGSNCLKLGSTLFWQSSTRHCPASKKDIAHRLFPTLLGPCNTKGLNRHLPCAMQLMYCCFHTDTNIGSGLNCFWPWRRTVWSSRTLRAM